MSRVQYALSAVILAILLGPQALYAQNIVRVEYYIDSDPGFGNATQLGITPAPELDLNFNANLSGISAGLHTLYVRAKDDSSKWSLSYTKPFWTLALDVAPNITKVEYYIDTDPAFEAGVDVPITPGSDVTQDFTVDLSGQSTGLHVLYIRAKDQGGNWSLSYAKPFITVALTVTPDITQVEYYVDTDPGFGAGVDVPITPGSEVTQDFTVDLSSQSEGLHVLYVRAKDQGGNWSLSYAKPFITLALTVAPDIAQVEYYIDTDPGYGAGVDVPITPGSDVTQDFTVDLSGQSEGLHVLYVRAKDQGGNWSLSYAKPFITVALTVVSDITQVEYYIDTDPGFGAGVDVPITPGSDITQTFTVDLTGQSEGLHVLYVRAKDQGGSWSLSYAKPFITVSLAVASNIMKAEYYIDTDPGLGNGVEMPITTLGTDITQDFTVDLSGQSGGLHVLYVRAQDESGDWSLSLAKSFTVIVDVSPEVVQMEYYIDTDPGFGAGVDVPISTPGNDVTRGFIVDLSSQSEGLHVLYVRAKDQGGNWSLSHAKPFTKVTLAVASDIVQMEYYIDTDPGFGAGVNVSIGTPGVDITQSLTVDLSVQSDGLHVLYIRAKDQNGSWSLSHAKPFTKVTLAVASDIVQMEYYIDTDPGFGAGVNVPIASPGVDITQSLTVDLSVQSDGLHVLYIRAKDQNGNWSLSYAKPFTKVTLAVASDIVQMEYYIDTDPGFGAGVNVSIGTPGVDITQSLTVDLSVQSDGLHVLYIRAKDQNGSWSLSHAKPFTKVTLAVASDIVKMEYYIDTDPGFGAGVNVSIVTPGVDITQSLTVDLSGQSDGLHVLYVRAKDQNGNWSLSYAKPFTKVTLAVASDIVQMEYYIDTDPGFGAGVNVPIASPGVDITQSLTVDLSVQSDGLHVLYIRAKDQNGNWSLSYAKPFTKVTLAVASDIVQMEYYIDTDPGFGAGVNVSIGTPGVDITQSLTVDLSVQSDGLHVLYIRAKDQNGSWSLSHAKPFTKVTLAVASDIVQMEYYIDTDPGFGAGVNVSIVTPGVDITQSLTVDLSGQSDGLHVLYIRAKDQNGNWSLSYAKPFTKVTLAVASDIVQMEYYIDTDPGFGAGVNVPIATPGVDITQSVTVDLSVQSDGLHVLYVRAKDQNGSWSLSYAKPFTKVTLAVASDIVQMEYYIDTDPGFGAGVNVPIVTPGVDITQSLTVDLSGQSDGLHVLYVRAKDQNGSWSLSYAKPFTKVTLAVASDIVQMEYYIDTDPGFGAGVDVSIATPGVDVEQSFVVDLGVQSDGLHVLYVRAKDQNGSWSLSYAKPFTKVTLAVASDIVQMEYYIDTDPGFGAAVDVAIATPGVDITQSLTVDLSGQSDGLHVLYIRAKDQNGSWSLSYAKPFTKVTLAVASDIVQMEYYIDTDPGFGAGVEVTIVTPGVDITQSLTVDLSGQGDGLHVLYIRAKDQNGNWSLSYAKPFTKVRREIAPNITAVEYYFIKDGTKTQVSTYTNFTSTTDVGANFVADISALDNNSSYNWHIYGIAEDDRRSLEYVHSFTVGNAPPVAVDDTVTTPEDTSIVIAVLSNDFDVAGDTLKVQSVDTTGTVGRVVVDPGDTTLTYAPKADFNGIDTFEYVVTDGVVTDTATVTVTVEPVNDAPGDFVRLLPADSSLVQRDSVLFLWTAASDADRDTVEYTISISFAQIDTSFVVEDTTLVVDFRTFELPKAQLPVTWLVVASDGIVTSGPTNGNGNFTLNTPLLFGDVSGNGEITSFDAVLILQHTVGLITLTDPFARVADVSDNGRISAFDAALVLRFVVGGISCLPADPDCGVLAKGKAVAGTLAWSETQSGDVPGHVDLPIMWNSEMGDVISAEFTVQIDTSFAKLVDVVSNLPGDWQMVYSFSSGELKVAMAGLTRISDARLATLRLLMSQRETEVTIRGVGSVNEEQEQELGAARVRYVPKEYALEQNYPNPFNPQTVIRYDLPVRSQVTLSVFNIVGQKVATLLNEEMDGGSYSIVWDGKDHSGRSLASGVYLYRLETDGFVQTKKLVLMR